MTPSFYYFLYCGTRQGFRSLSVLEYIRGIDRSFDKHVLHGENRSPFEIVVTMLEYHIFLKINSLGPSNLHTVPFFDEKQTYLSTWGM